jgi:hypothetical protein
MAYESSTICAELKEAAGGTRSIARVEHAFGQRDVRNKIAECVDALPAVGVGSQGRIVRYPADTVGRKLALARRDHRFSDTVCGTGYRRYVSEYNRWRKRPATHKAG